MNYLFLVKTDNSKKPNTNTGIATASLDLNLLFKNIEVKTNIEFYDDWKQIPNIIRFNNPSNIIIEDLFVLPEILFELKNMFPNIIWLIRTHTAIMFNGSEFFTMDWTAKYLKMSNVNIITNDQRYCNELKILYSVLDNDKNINTTIHINTHAYTQTETSTNNILNKTNNNKITYLPNYYHIDKIYNCKNIKSKETNIINICCFGALRPLKNNLIQAFAAIEFCKKINKKLNFHINSRPESGGSEYEKNLLNIFSHSNTNYNLICHEWKTRNDFFELCKTMDIGMQVSLSETFNIVAADLVVLGIPLVGSNEIPWLSHNSITNTTDVNDIVNKLLFAYENEEINVSENQNSLLNYVNNSKDMWKNYLLS